MDHISVVVSCVQIVSYDYDVMRRVSPFISCHVYMVATIEVKPQ